MHNSANNINEVVYKDQVYEVALLVGYRRNCSYCGID